MDLAAVSLATPTQAAVIGMAREDVSTIVAAHESIFDAVDNASLDMSGSISWGRNPADAFDELESAQSNMVEVLGPFIEEARDLLPAELRQYVTRAVSNLGIRAPYRLLDLSAEQREQVLAFQRERDRVLADARQRERPDRLEAAEAEFQRELSRVLTADQRAELAQFQANIAANLETVLDREYANDEEVPTAEDAEGAGQASRQPKSVPHPSRSTGSRTGAGHPSEGTEQASVQRKGLLLPMRVPMHRDPGWGSRLHRDLDLWVLVTRVAREIRAALSRAATRADGPPIAAAR